MMMEYKQIMKEKRAFFMGIPGSTPVEIPSDARIVIPADVVAALAEESFRELRREVKPGTKRKRKMAKLSKRRNRK